MKGKRRESPLEVKYPNCAGIDVGKRELYVAVSEDADDDNVRSFGAFTDELEELASWLGSCGVEQVAMEATGVYWIPVYEVLDRAGFEVRLVDPRQTKRPDGRKSDVQDCQWIRQLMSLGLLSGAHRAPDAFCALRSYARQRDRLIKDRARQVLHMQKALTQMNVQLDSVLSDIVGKSGLAILGAVVAGERDPDKLAALCDGRVKASGKTVARSLRGNWRDEHLHELRVALRHFEFLERELDQLDKLIEQETERLEPPPEENPETGEVVASEEEELRHPHPRRRERQRQLALRRVAGVDLTAIEGVGPETALLVVAEIGADVSAFPTAKHFCSWLALSPDNRISGGKLLKPSSRRKANRLGQAFRQCAVSVRRSDTWLGAKHRRRLARMEKAKAVKATAHEIARLVYAMLRDGTEYIERSLDEFESEYRERKLENLQRQARSIGCELVPQVPAPALAS